jgi:hypothetical protein
MNRFAPLTFRCEPYAIYWGIQGWSLYNMTRRQALIAKNTSLSECLEKAEQDALQTQKR